MQCPAIVCHPVEQLHVGVDDCVWPVRWDPDRENILFLRQSAILLSHYYQFQIAVHRPFISTRRQSPLLFPSLVICTNAARSGIRVVNHLYQRTGDPSYKNLVCALSSVYYRSASPELTFVTVFFIHVRCSTTTERLGREEVWSCH